LLAGMMVFSKKVAKAIEKAVPCKKIGLAVLGLEVPHAHIHMIPINKLGDINFANPKLKFSQEDLTTTANAIIAQL